MDAVSGSSAVDATITGVWRYAPVIVHHPGAAPVNHLVSARGTGSRILENSVSTTPDYDNVVLLAAVELMDAQVRLFSLNPVL